MLTEWNVNSFIVIILEKEIFLSASSSNVYAHLSLDSLFIALSLFHTPRLWVMMLISNYCDRSYDYVYSLLLRKGERGITFREYTQHAYI
jgi:hypothetical protein